MGLKARLQWWHRWWRWCRS